MAHFLARSDEPGHIKPFNTNVDILYHTSGVCERVMNNIKSELFWALQKIKQQQQQQKNNVDLPGGGTKCSILNYFVNS